MTDPMPLYPPPARLQSPGGLLDGFPPSERSVRLPADCKLDLLWALGDSWSASDLSDAWLRFDSDASIESEQGYRLVAGSGGIVIHAREQAGWFLGAITLHQWLSQHAGLAEIPCIHIEDAPQIPRRGYMLDVSRDRVPTMAELRRVIDQLARLKYNHLELYLEHAFAYVGHESVHRDSGPITSDEMRELVSYAAVRGIEMVPNQNTFGHMHRWLVEPDYNHLAEEPEGTLHAFDFRREPFGLCPAKPGSLELIEDLLAQLLPLFDSPFFNGGLDETFDLGRGGSADLCAQRGKGVVYMDYLRAVQHIADQHGKHLVFWADILLEHPEVFEELPAGCIPVIWGYEADHPLDAQAKALSDIGAEFWIAPGTSSWQSLTGRFSNCVENIRSAVRAALAHGASGVVLTDWGDWGHWQPPSLSHLGILHFAIQAWSGPDQPAPDARSIDQIFYAGREAHLVRAWMQLWQASEVLQDGVLNGTSPFYAMRYPRHGLHPEGEWKKRCPGWNLQESQAYGAELTAILERLSTHPTQHPEARELRFCILLAQWANARAQERGQNQPPAPEADPQLQAIEAELASLWILRARTGGLPDALRKLRFALHPDGVRIESL